MKYVGTAFVATVLLIAAWTMATIQPMIPAFAAGAAELLSLAVRACISIAVLIVAALLLWVFLRQRHEANRQRDGAFPLREYWLEPWTKRLWNLLTGKPSARVIYDQNAAMSHAAVIAGGVWVAEPPAGWDRQLAYLADVERTRRVQAAIAGDAVLGNPFIAAGNSLGGVANAATGRLLAGAYDKPVKPVAFVDAQPEPARLPAPELSPEDAVAQSTPTEIVMGQTVDGELVRWDMTQMPHVRVHGTSRGAGKTNVIQTLAAGAQAHGAHVLVCDRVQFKDWQDFRHCAEFADTTDPQALANVAARLYNIYLGRMQMLRDAGARDITKMRQPMQRIVVVLSEFGAQMESARAEGVIKEVEYPLTQLARLAAATGIHLVAEDQAVRNWPRALTANMWPIIGRLPAYDGQACGYQGRGGGTNTFPPYTFAFEGALFRAPLMEPALPSLLANVPPPKALVLKTPAAVIPQEDGEGSSAFGHSVEPAGGGATSGSERPNVQPNAPQPNAEPAGPTDLQVLVWQWRDAHPEGTQAEMRADFEARSIVIARGYAHECWHKWTPDTTCNPGQTVL